jgi:hypothetical protein
MRYGQGLNKAGFYFRWYLAALCKTPVWNKPLQLGFLHGPQKTKGNIFLLRCQYEIA